MAVNKKHISTKTKIVGIICMLIISIVFILLSLGKYSPLPFPPSTDIKNVASEAKSNNTDVIVDNSGMRLLFLDDNDRIISAIQTNILSNSVTSYLYCTCDDKYTYVSEYSYEEDSSNITSEKVVRYTHDGKKLETMFSINYEDVNNGSGYPLIQHLAIDSDNLYITKALDRFKGFEVIKISLANTDNNNQDSQNNESRVTRNFRYISSLPDNQTIFNISYYPETDIIATVTTLGKIYKFYNNASKISVQDLIRPIYSSVFVSNVVNDNAIIQTEHLTEGMTLFYSARLEARIILYWLGILILLAIVIGAIVTGVRWCIKNNKYKPIKTALIICGAIILSLTIVFYYSSAFTKKSAESLSQGLSSLSAVLTSSQKQLLTNCIMEYQNTGEISQDIYNQTLTLLEEATEEARKSGLEIEFTLSASESNNKAVLLVDSYNSIISLVKVPELNIEEENLDISIEKMQSNAGEFIYAKNPIVNEGKAVGSLAAVCRFTVFNSTLIRECLGLFVTLIAAIVTVSFFIMELNSFFTAYRRKKALENKKYSHPEIALARPIAFLAVFATSCDAALVTLIAKDMIPEDNTLNVAMLVSLPLAFISVGYFIGVFLHAKLLAKYPTKSVLLFGSTIMLLSFLVCFYAVLCQNFILLLLGLLFANAFNEIGFLFAAALPMYIKNGKTRAKANRDLSAARISGSSVAILVSGFLVGIYGNAYVYIAAVIVVVIYTIYLIVAFPKTADCKSLFQNKNTKGSSVAQMKDFISNPAIIVLIILVVAVCSISQGYKSYLFPLYAADNNISKLLISNIVVFVNAIIFYTIPIVSKIENKLSSRAMIIISCSILGFGFVSLLINLSIIWSIIVLFISCLIVKVLDPSITNYWQNYVAKYNKTKIAGQKVSYFATNLYAALKSPILGALLNVGYTFSVGVLGVCSIVSGALFWITSKTEQNKNQNK